jgi:cytochrome c553
MERKLFPLILIVASGMIFLWVASLTATVNRKDAPAKIKIDNRGYKKNQYRAITFDHEKHQDKYKNPKSRTIACAECHHVYEKGKNIWKDDDKVQKCVECHDPKKNNVKNKKQKKLQLAFHNNCKTCHKAVVKAGLKKEKDAPSKKCIQCMGKKR